MLYPVLRVPSWKAVPVDQLQAALQRIMDGKRSNIFYSAFWNGTASRAIVSKCLEIDQAQTGVQKAKDALDKATTDLGSC
eukprot:3155051-Alexandrium_andersonii.AAC.1